ARDEIVTISDEVLARPDRPISVREEIFRINVLGLDWDIGGMVYEPTDPAGIARGADGKQVGIFLLHGGGGDHRGKDQMGRFLAAKFGYKVATMTYPGHLYLLDPSRDWPGDTINPDGTARTPLWQIDQPITADQYELVQDRSDPVLRAKYGTLFFLKAKEGTDFYDRMASWPMAFEEAMKEVCRRNFPVGEWTVYVHGHSTGGPFVHMLLQRVSNIAGLVGMESSPFGFIFGKMLKQGWDFPFNWITVRTWRHIAKYAGSEAGEGADWRLPWLMEDVFDAWDKVKHQPQFKAEYFVTIGATAPLGEAARASARRLNLDAAETEALVKRFQGYPRELSGPDVRPVPPLLYGINADSRDHTIERYRNQLLPELAAMNPAPKVRVMRFGTGVHNYERPEDGLPRGTLPAVVELWDRAITGGYYLPEA
ncbi:MAG: hypothetical protein ACRDGQ_14625, partial [Candidatus Limnocylindrales bacterium]